MGHVTTGKWWGHLDAHSRQIIRVHHKTHCHAPGLSRAVEVSKSIITQFSEHLLCICRNQINATRFEHPRPQYHQIQCPSNMHRTSQSKMPQHVRMWFYDSGGVLSTVLLPHRRRQPFSQRTIQHPLIPKPKLIWNWNLNNHQCNESTKDDIEEEEDNEEVYNDE